MRILPLPTLRSQRGFTLVEMMVAITIALIIMAGVAGVFISHSRTYNLNDDVSALQQTLRGVMMVMAPEIRMAGCDPSGKAGAKIEQAKKNEFEFTADFAGSPGRPNDADGELKDPGERVTYKFMKGRNCGDTMNVPGGELCREAQGQGNGLQPIADNIEELEFNYVMENGSSTTEPARSKLRDIRAVQISILARADRKDDDFYSTSTFTSASGATWPNLSGLSAEDKKEEAHHRRRLLVTTIQIRNTGYKR